MNVLNDELKSIKTLIIDNYDSYTFNLLQLCHNPDNVVVIRNDQFSWEEFTANILPHFDNIIISPGPGRPERSSDFGICTLLLKAQLDPDAVEWHRPVFGVCLGHQGIAHLMGGKVVHAPRIMHGRLSQIHRHYSKFLHYGDLFKHIPDHFWAVRYHSLVVDPLDLPKDLMITATCFENDADIEALKNMSYEADHDTDLEGQKRNHFFALSPEPATADSLATVMAFQHKTLPIWGVQFHPESVSTEYGTQMMHNFTAETWRWLQSRNNQRVRPETLDPELLAMSVAGSKLTIMPSNAHKAKPALALYTKSITPHWVDIELLVEELLSGTARKDMHVWAASWLDSSRTSSSYSRMSILSVDPAYTLTYTTLHRQVHRVHRAGHYAVHTLPKEETFFDHLSHILAEVGPLNSTDDIPAFLSFHGGLVGYFGYEMKRESMDGYVTPKEQHCACDAAKHVDGCCKCVLEPDAAFQFVDRFWAIDRAQRSIHVCCLVRTDSQSASDAWLHEVGISDEAARAWMHSAESSVLQAAEAVQRRKLATDFIDVTPISSVCSSPTPGEIPQRARTTSDLLTPAMKRSAYIDTIRQCIEEIKEGESYELCLTTRFQLTIPDNRLTHDLYHAGDDNSDAALWRLYTRHLRKNNPAPFSALLHFPSCNVAVLSSSPERFLKIQDGIAEMKPIKGTVARVLQCICPESECSGWGPDCEERCRRADEERKQSLWQDVKERAENLMIVDLIRNDLAQVCEPQSVEVPKLMHVETYEKVHHLVSTIRGALRPHLDSVQAVRTCFPPGSMTGAPKLRSVQLLDQLECHRPRGVYSGSLGYFSLNERADFNVVIRTAVVTPSSNGELHISVGGGGAITFLSNPEEEWKETVLKTRSVAPSVQEFLGK